MHAFPRILCLVLVACALCAAAPRAEAQLVKRLKDRAKDKVEQKVGEKQDQAIDQAIDGKSSSSSPGAAPSAAPGASSAGSGAAGAGEGGTPAERMKPGEGAWVNYDFVPGERVLFYDDFGSTNVGDFPRRLGFASGNMEVAEWSGARYLRCTSDCRFTVPLPETLPDRFTIEFDFYPSYWPLHLAAVTDVEDLTNIGEDTYIYFTRGNAGLAGGSGPTADAYYEEGVRWGEQVMRARMMFDGSYVKVYVNQQRVANVPNARFRRSGALQFYTYAMTEDPALIGGLRIAAGGRQVLYDALSAEGRVTTPGILFDTGSDRLRPESTPTLKDIAQMLQQHADLRLRIEGHTDDTGNAETNQRLSQQRAAAVKAFLVEAYKIDGARLETQGFGPTSPVAANDTPEGRQMNRRVELVRL